MALTAAAIAELQNINARWHTVVELDTPDGTTHRLSMEGEPVTSASLGAYTQRVKSVSPLSYMQGGFRGGIEGKNVTISIADSDGWFRDLVERFGSALDAAPVRVKWAAA